VDYHSALSGRQLLLSGPKREWSVVPVKRIVQVNSTHTAGDTLYKQQHVQPKIPLFPLQVVPRRNEKIRRWMIRTNSHSPSQVVCWLIITIVELTTYFSCSGQESIQWSQRPKKEHPQITLRNI